MRGGRAALSTGLQRSMNPAWWNLFVSASGAIPSLILDYSGIEGGRYMADNSAKIFDDLHTFTRASTATVRNSAGLITTSATGTKRLDHDKDGNRLGLLIEEARTNECLQSEDFSTIWIPVGAPVITTNSVTAPDGNTTADTIEDDAGFESLLQNITIANDSTSWTFSIYVLKDSNTSRFPEIQIIFTGGTTVAAAVQLNTSTGAINHRLGAGTVSAEDAGDYWRLVITEKNNSTGNTILEARIFPAVTATFGLVQQGATGSIIVWGAQVENAAFPSSYIPTTTVAVTRAAETCSVAQSNFSIDLTKGALRVEFTPYALEVDTNQHVARFLGAGPDLIITSNTVNTIQSNLNGVASLKIGISNDITTRVMLAYDQNDAALSVNGAASVAFDPLTFTLTTADLEMGGDQLGPIKSVAFYGARISNADIETLTT